MLLTEYIQTAMRQAVYEILPDDGTYYGSIPGLQGVWANADTLSECQQELQSTLEGWILLGLHLRHTIPILNGFDLNPQPQEVAA
jgi:predicted RNase H-like HicB family nuclease